MSNDYPTYQSHDIEWFLTNKEFAELSDGERDFVLSQVSSPEEYSELRHTLMNIQASFGTEDVLEPELSVKDSLFAEFDRLHSTGTAKDRPSFWNTLFPRDRSIFLSPGFQLASLAVLIIGLSFLFVNQNNNSEQVAINEIPKVESNKTLERENDSRSKDLDDQPAEVSPSTGVSNEQLEEDKNQPSPKKEEAPSPVMDNLSISDVVHAGSTSRSTSGAVADSSYFRKDVPGKTEAFASTTAASNYANDITLEESSVVSKNVKTGDSKKKNATEKKKAEGGYAIGESESARQENKTVKADKYSGVGSPASVHPDMLELLFTAL
jgi:hypothetical protein